MIAIVGATVGVLRVDRGGSSARVAIGPRQSTDIPEGWTRVELDSGISFAMPPTWGVFEFGNTPVAERRIAIGSARPAGDAVMMACASGAGQLPTEAGSWVTLHEYVGNPGRGELTLPSGDGSDFASIPDRPSDFRAREPFASCPVDGTGLTASFEELAFRDAGRVFVARIVTASPTGDPPDLTDGQQVLNSLRISPLPATTTAVGVAPAVPSISAPTTTTAPAFVPTSDDEQQISELFVAWQRNHPDDETRAMVEDADALLDTIHQGIAQAVR